MIKIKNIGSGSSDPLFDIPAIGGGGRGKGSKILIAVVTAPDHFRAREAILNSYGTAAHREQNDFDLHFFVADLSGDKAHLNEQINSEPFIIRLTGFTDSYDNLSKKTLGVFNWAHDNGYTSVFKVDDDTFIRPNYLRQFISGTDMSHSIAGTVITGARQIENPKSKWYMRDQYPDEYIPPYISGGAVLLGSDGLSYLSGQRGSLKFYRVEDQGTGIWLKDQNFNFINMAIGFYPPQVSATSVAITPVNYVEMVELSKGDGTHVQLQVCRETCLCARTDGCWNSFGSNEYRDIIPRYIPQRTIKKNEELQTNDKKNPQK